MHPGLEVKGITASTDYIRFFTFLLAYCLSVFKHVEKKKTDINQQDLKIFDLHFIKSE